MTLFTSFSAWGGLAAFLGSGVEFVEALSIILAVGVVKGWRSSLAGALGAVIVLGVLVAVIGAPLVHLIQVPWVQLLVGLFMLLFGIRWLKKSILRYCGLQSLHNEEKSYAEEIERQESMGGSSAGWDYPGMATTFMGTFLEGLEAVFIVITFGLSAHAMGPSIEGAALALVVVLLAGVLVRKPLSQVPENTLKFIVGIMLTSFGAFWVGESMNVSWPYSDGSIAIIAATLLVFSWIEVSVVKNRMSNLAAGESGKAVAGK